MGLDKLKHELIEEGRGHPFVEALVASLRERRAALLNELEGIAASGGDESPYGTGYIYALGGRAREVRTVVDMIQNTKGMDE
jgi:hypothetical protein